MRKVNGAIKYLLLIFISVSLISCKSTSNDSADEKDALMLEIKNSTSYDSSKNNLIYGDITVKLIPDTDNVNFSGSDKIVNYGTLAVGKSSGLKAAPSNFNLEINGEVYDRGSSSFGIGKQPTGKWLLEIQAVYDQGNGNSSLAWNLEAIF